MWLLDRIENAPVTYNMPWALRLRGQLNQQALGKSLAAIVERHAPLRTVIQAGPDGEPRGYLLEAPTPEQILTITDLSSSQLTQEQSAQEVKKLLADEAATAFDLSCEYAIRAQLFVLQPQEFVLALTLHHHAADGMSTNVFIRDLGAAYEAFHQNITPQWPLLKIQYADWAAWQRNQLNKKDASDQTALTAKILRAKSRLINCPEVLSLPLDRVRDPQRERRSAIADVKVPKNLAQKIEALAKNQRTTVYAVMLAAYAATLARIANQTAVVIGSPSANRTRNETKDLIGFFVNSLVLPIQMNTTIKVAELIHQTRQTVEDVLADQDLPFELLVDALGMERSLAHTPVFQAGFSFQSFSSKEEALHF